jgi:hypothetical protein
MRPTRAGEGGENGNGSNRSEAPGLKTASLSWNAVLPWNRVLAGSMSIFQTSYEHALVALPCAHGALSDRI